MLLTEFFETVYFPRRLRGKSDRSAILYRLTIKQFSKSVGRSALVADLTEENVFKHLHRRSEVAPATRNKELSQITAMWRMASQRKLIDTWPDVKPEHEPERAPIAWLPDELAKLLDAATRVPGKVDECPAWIWWSALIRLTLDTGERISAIRYAQWSWLQGEWLLVPAENRKGKTRDRRYRISRDTAQALALLRCNGAGGKPIFPWPWTDNYLWVKYKEVLKIAGLPDTRKHQMHCLRKTVASAVFAAGMDPQDTLDHSDHRTTQQYIDPRFTREKQACDILAEFLRNPPAAADRRSGTDRRQTG